MRWTRIFAWLAMLTQTLDGTLAFLNPASNVGLVQRTDGFLTGLFIFLELYSFIVIGCVFAFGKRRGLALWLVAIFAMSTDLISALRTALQQGQRFTHWSSPVRSPLRSSSSTATSSIFFLSRAPYFCSRSSSPSTVTCSKRAVAGPSSKASSRAPRNSSKYSSPKSLSGLNRRLLGRLPNGFVTCLVLRIDSSGVCVVAGAGHPAPFLNRQEIDLPAALPLGIAPSAAFENVSLQLTIGDRLTLYTDGLLEARNTGGELFGFDRLSHLLAGGPDARRACEAAVAFGQEDDITVLTITRLAVGVESTTDQS
jgi:hypothetical protein